MRWNLLDVRCPKKSRGIFYASWNLTHLSKVTIFFDESFSRYWQLCTHVWASGIQIKKNSVRIYPMYLLVFYLNIPILYLILLLKDLYIIILIPVLIPGAQIFVIFKLTTYMFYGIRYTYTYFDWIQFLYIWCIPTITSILD